jgi:hypothetical protein
MSVPKDKELYAKMIERGKAMFPNAWPSAYASAWVVRQYKKAGGDYEGGDLGNWFREGWIDVVPLLKEGRLVKCGKGKGSACRPTKRINKDTPITLQELLEIYSVKEILKFAERKVKNMELKAQWRELEFK